MWLDIEQLTSGQMTGMFEQITTGLINSKVVCAFVSSQYARSENCKMEFQVSHHGIVIFLLTPTNRKIIMVNMDESRQMRLKALNKSFDQN